MLFELLIGTIMNHYGNSLDLELLSGASIPDLLEPFVDRS